MRRRPAGRDTNQTAYDTVGTTVGDGGRYLYYPDFRRCHFGFRVVVLLDRMD